MFVTFTTMNKFKIFILLLFVCLSVKGENSCVNAPINFLVYENIGSIGENVTTTGKITYESDIFHLLVINATIPKLCKNQVLMEHELSVLQIINASIHEIEPEAFNITPTLSLLRISLNPTLASIKANIFNGIKVKEIDLSDNQITSIESKAFDHNTHLEIVKLNNNHLNALNPRWFFNSSVYKLSIIYNDIKSIPARAFDNLSKTKPLNLRLSTNRITEISPEALHGHHSIAVLRLNGNKLSSLPEALFVNRTIRNLQVMANDLRCFPDILFSASTQTVNLAFSDNTQFQCNCLERVKKFSEDFHVAVIYPAIICKDVAREVNIVYNYNKTYEIPYIPRSVDVDVYGQPINDT